MACDAGVTTPDDAFIMDMYNKAWTMYQATGANPPPQATNPTDAIAGLTPLLRSILEPQYFETFGYMWNGGLTSPPKMISGEEFHGLESFNALSAADEDLVNQFVSGDLPNQVGAPDWLQSAAGESLLEVGMEWTNNKTFTWESKQFEGSYKEEAKRFGQVEAKVLVYNGAATVGGVEVAYDVIYFIGGWYFTKQEED